MEGWGAAMATKMDRVRLGMRDDSERTAEEEKAMAKREDEGGWGREDKGDKDGGKAANKRG